MFFDKIRIFASWVKYNLLSQMFLLLFLFHLTYVFKTGILRECSVNPLKLTCQHPQVTTFRFIEASQRFLPFSLLMFHQNWLIDLSTKATSTMLVSSLFFCNQQKQTDQRSTIPFEKKVTLINEVRSTNCVDHRSIQRLHSDPFS